MRLLHVINSANPRGGGPIEAIYQTILELQPRGHENEVVCVDPPGSPWLNRLGCPVHAVGPGKTSYRYSSGIQDWMNKNLGRFDAALVHSVWQYPGHALSRTALRLKIPYFVYTHGSLDPAHKRVFWTKHPKKMAMWILKERSMLENARGVFFTCDEEKELALNSFWPGLSGLNAAVVPYCTGEPPRNIEQQKSEFQQAFPELNQRPFLLFLSRLHPKKGPDLLIQAFARVRSVLPDHLLVMAGPGDESYVNGLQRMTRDLGIDRAVLWPGMLSGNLKWGAFRSADAFVLCSHQENFGIAVVESLACCLPVLTTDRVNIWKTIAESSAGIIGSDTADSCEDLLRKWALMTADERDQMRVRARSCFENNYSAHNAAEILLSVLRERGVRNLELSACDLQSVESHT